MSKKKSEGKVEDLVSHYVGFFFINLEISKAFKDQDQSPNMMSPSPNLPYLLK